MADSAKGNSRLSRGKRRIEFHLAIADPITDVDHAAHESGSIEFVEYPLGLDSQLPCVMRNL